MLSKLKSLHKNVYYLSFIGFLMQFGATLVYSTGNALVKDVLITAQQLVFIRIISESVASFVKIFAGYVSDQIKNRKIFLIIGNGAMIVFKIFFFITTLRSYFPLYFLATLYMTTQFLDRVMNCLRDAPRDALILDSTEPELKAVSFGFRKFIASFGTVLGGIFGWFIIKYQLVNTTQLYFIAIIPVLIANIILYITIKDIKEVKINKKNKILEFIKQYKKDILTIFFKFIFSIIILYSFIYFKELIINKTIYYEYLSKLLLFTLFNLNFSIIPQLFGLILTILFSKKICILSIFIITAMFSGIQFLIIKSGLKDKIYKHKSELKPFGIILIFSNLLFLSRINDTVFFNQAELIGFARIDNALIFSLLYASIGIFSMIYSKIIEKRKNIAIYIMILSLFICNISMIYLRTKVWFIFSIINLGMCTAGLDSIIPTLVSDTIPSSDMKATIFGILFSSIGIMSIINGILIANFSFNSVAIFSSILSLFSFIFIFIYNNFIQKNNIN